MSLHGSRGRRRALTSLVSLAAITVMSPGIASAQDIPTGYQRYHVIGHEQHVWDMFQYVRDQQGSGDFADYVRSIVSITASSYNQVIIYDHWEDGFEADIDNPVQSSTLVFGDLDRRDEFVRDLTGVGAQRLFDVLGTAHGTDAGGSSEPGHGGIATLLGRLPLQGFLALAEFIEDIHG